MGNLSAGKFIIYAESFGKEDTNNEAPEPVRRIPQADEEKRVSKHSADALPWERGRVTRIPKYAGDRKTKEP